MCSLNKVFDSIDVAFSYSPFRMIFNFGPPTCTKSINIYMLFELFKGTFNHFKKILNSELSGLSRNCFIEQVADKDG